MCALASAWSRSYVYTVCICVRMRGRRSAKCVCVCEETARARRSIHPPCPFAHPRELVDVVGNDGCCPKIVDHFLFMNLLSATSLPDLEFTLPPTQDILDQAKWRSRVMPAQRHSSSIIMLYQQRYHEQVRAWRRVCVGGGVCVGGRVWA